MGGCVSKPKVLEGTTATEAPAKEVAAAAAAEETTESVAEPCENNNSSNNNNNNDIVTSDQMEIILEEDPSSVEDDSEKKTNGELEDAPTTHADADATATEKITAEQGDVTAILEEEVVVENKNNESTNASKTEEQS